MAKTLLRSGCLDDFLALGENGQAVFDSALQIRETLRLRKLHAVADSLAIPQPNDEGDRVDWYASFEGNVLSWVAASSEQRKKALRYLDNCHANVATLIQRCQQAEKTAIQLFGSLLVNALQFPGSQHVYLVDGKPVITFWGFVNLNQSAREDVLDCLRVVEVPEPIIEFISKPRPEVASDAASEPASVKENILSDPQAPLVYTARPRIAPEPATIIAEAVPAPPEAAKPKARFWLFPVAAAALAFIATPVAYKFLSSPVTQPLAVAKTESKPQPIEPAAIQSVEAAPAIAVEKKVKTTLPLTEAAVVAPSAPEPAVEQVPAASAVTKSALVLPADAVKIGSTKFLNGTWHVLVDVKDPITGKPPTLHYQIANNKGSARLVHGDNIACKVEVFSGLQSSGTLMIKTRGSARCNDGSRFPMPEISCKSGDNGVAECSGRYEGDTVVPITIKKVSD